MGKPRINLSDFDEMLNFEQETNTPDVADSPVPVLQNGGMTEMDFDQMEFFPNHKFKLYEGQQLADMVESVKPSGRLWHRGKAYAKSVLNALHQGLQKVYGHGNFWLGYSRRLCAASQCGTVQDYRGIVYCPAGIGFAVLRRALRYGLTDPLWLLMTMAIPPC